MRRVLDHGLLPPSGAQVKPKTWKPYGKWTRAWEWILVIGWHRWMAEISWWAASGGSGGAIECKLLDLADGWWRLDRREILGKEMEIDVGCQIPIRKIRWLSGAGSVRALMNGVLMGRRLAVSPHRLCSCSGIRTRACDAMELWCMADVKSRNPLSPQANGCAGLGSGESEQHHISREKIGRLRLKPRAFDWYDGGKDPMSSNFARHATIWV